MLRTLLKSKLHRFVVTNSELNYEGSCAIDSTLLKAADILPFEQIQIYNVTNGERFTTYAIEAVENSGIISVNGAAAHKASVGDILIIATYCNLENTELSMFNPTLVYASENNRIKNVNNSIKKQEL